MKKLHKVRQDAAKEYEESILDLERAIRADTVTIGANNIIAVQPNQLIRSMMAETAVETPDASATAATPLSTAVGMAVESPDAPISMSATAAAPLDEATEEQTVAAALAPLDVPLSMSATAAAPTGKTALPTPAALFAPLTQAVVPAVDAAGVAGLPSLDASAAPDYPAPTAPAPPQTAPAPPRTAFVPQQATFKDWAYETALKLSTVSVAPDDPIAMATAAATTTVSMASAAVARHGARGAGHEKAPRAQRRSMLQAVATRGFTPVTSTSSGPSRTIPWASGSGNSAAGSVGGSRTNGALRSAAYDPAAASRSWHESRTTHASWQERTPSAVAASPSSWTHAAGAPAPVPAPAPAPPPPPATDVEIVARRTSPLHRRRGRGLLSGPLVALLVVNVWAVVRPQGLAFVGGVLGSLFTQSSSPLGLAAFGSLALLARRRLAHAF